MFIKIAILSLGMLSGQLYSAVSYDGNAVTFTDAAPGAGAVTHPFTVSPGSGKILFVVISFEGLETNCAITYGGQTLTSVHLYGGASGSWFIYSLVNPPTGSNTLSVTANPAYFSGPINITSFSYSNVDTLTPLGAVVGQGATWFSAPFQHSVGITTTSSTSTILQVGNLTSASLQTTYVTNNGTMRHITYTSLNNPHAIGIADWSPGVAAPLSFMHTVSGGAGTMSAPMYVQAVELMAGPMSTVAPTSTATPPTSPTKTESPTSTSTYSPTASRTRSPTRTASPTGTPTRTALPTSTATPTASPTQTSSPLSTALPSVTVTGTPSLTLTPSPIYSTTDTPTPLPTVPLVTPTPEDNAIRIPNIKNLGGADLVIQLKSSVAGPATLKALVNGQVVDVPFSGDLSTGTSVVRWDVSSFVAPGTPFMLIFVDGAGKMSKRIFVYME